jgi:hypothetical protein
MNRRHFIKLGVVGTGVALTGVEAVSAQNIPTVSKPSPTMVAMPISVAPLAQRDLDAIFDDMRNRAGVNALFPFIYTHEPSRAGLERVEGFHGGNYALPHMEFYKDTKQDFADLRAPEFGDMDVLARVIPVARKHGIRVFPFLLEDNALPATVPHRQAFYEVDHHGRPASKRPGGPCFNNPHYQNFTLGLVEDYARSYEIGGMMWGSERQGGLLNTLGVSQSGGEDPGLTTCFCEFCLKKGRDRGIDVERTRLGFDEIEKFTLSSRAGQRPRDGYFSAFWRLLLNHPEVLAWENLWVTSRHEFRAAIYQKVKSINPALQVGWHGWQNISFNPFHRAEENYADVAGFADFIRPAVYNNVAGGRFVAFVKNARGSVFGDLPPEVALDVLYRELGYPNEATYDKLAATGFSEDYVEREVRRTVESVSGHPVQVWPGVDIDVPVSAGESHCTPEGVGLAVKAAFKGGAQGIILSRNYIEMKPDNLSGAGAALKDLGII